MIKGVIFDVGGTIIWKNGKRYLKANAWTASNYLRSLGYDFNHKEFSTRLESLQKDSPKTGQDLEQLNTTKEHITLLCKDFNIPLSEELLNEITKAFFIPEVAGAVALPEITQVIQSLKDKVSLAILSNTRSHILIVEILKKLGLDGFDIIATSAKAGYRKPSPNFFRAVSDNWHYKPEEIVMIGDLPHKDVVGAKAMGMKSIWINIDSDYDDDYGADAIATSPKDILTILESWGLDLH